MKARKYFVVLLVLLSHITYSQNAISLKEAILVALNTHPSSTIAKNNAEIARKKVTETKSSFLPTVAGSVNTDYNLKLQTSVIPAGTFGDKETRLQMGNKYSSGAVVQADLNLIDRSTRMGVQSSKIDEEIADLNVLKENETLIYNTASAYYEAQSLAEKKKLLKENEKQNQQLLSILKLRYEQGVVKKSEYDRTRVNLANIQSELSMNESSYQLAINKLKNAMGIELTKDVKISDTVSVSVPGQLEEIEDVSNSNLVSYKIDQKNLQLKQIDIRKKQAAYLPTLAVYGRYGANAYGKDPSIAFNQWFDYSAVGVKLTIPIFSGLKRNSQLAQSRLNERNQELTVRLNNDTYKLDYQNASIQYINSYNNLKNNKANLELAKDVVDATEIEYREGTADLTTYMDADASYREAQSNYTTSLLDFLTSQLSFEKAKGTLTQYITNL